jgi:hypothetical protein
VRGAAGARSLRAMPLSPTLRLIHDLVTLYGPGSGDPAVQLAINELNDPALDPKPDDLARALRIISGDTLPVDDVSQYVALLRRIRDSRV